MKPSLPVICNYYGIRNPKFHLSPIKHAFAEQRIQYYLEPITNIITIILEIVLVFMHQLAQLKQVIELSATEGYIFGITFHKKSIQIHHIPVLKKL